MGHYRLRPLNQSMRNIKTKHERGARFTRCTVCHGGVCILAFGHVVHSFELVQIDSKDFFNLTFLITILSAMLAQRNRNDYNYLILYSSMQGENRLILIA